MNNNKLSKENEMKQKPKFIWVYTLDDGVNINTATSLVEILKVVMEMYAMEYENLEITEKDEKIIMIYPDDMDDQEINNNAYDITEFLNELYAMDGYDLKFGIQELVFEEKKNLNL